MHLTTTNPVSGVWCQNTGAGVIPAISFTRLSRRNARISAHAMRMRAYVRISAHAMRMRAFSRMRCECAHMRACDANARTCAHFPACDAMRCEANARMRCDANARIKGELMRVRYCMCHLGFRRSLDVDSILAHCYPRMTLSRGQKQRPFWPLSTRAFIQYILWYLSIRYGSSMEIDFVINNDYLFHL